MNRINFLYINHAREQQIRLFERLSQQSSNLCKSEDEITDFINSKCFTFASKSAEYGIFVPYNLLYNSNLIY